jgi:hypothetical protein
MGVNVVVIVGVCVGVAVGVEVDVGVSVTVKVRVGVNVGVLLRHRLVPPTPESQDALLCVEQAALQLPPTGG